MLLQVVSGLSPFAGMLTFTSAARPGYKAQRPNDSPSRFPLGADLQRRDQFVHHDELCAVPSDDAARLHRDRAPDGRIFRSLQFTALGTLAYADVPNSMMSGASTLSSMAQQLFLSLGVALGAMLLHLSLTAHGGHFTTSDFTPAFVVMGVLALLSSLFFPLEYHAGDEVSGRRTSSCAHAADRDRSGLIARSRLPKPSIPLS